MTRAWRIWGAGAAGVALLLACGGSEEKPQPSGAPMSGAPPAAAASGPNRPPVVERVRLEPDEPIPGGGVRALVQASDPDGNPVRLRYAWTLDGAAAGSDAQEITLVQGRKGQELEVTVLASDGTSDSAPMRASTRLGNRRPRLDAVTLEPASGLQVGGAVKVVPEAVDPDDDELRYDVTWRVNGQPAGEHGLELDTKRLRRGDHIQAEVRASDGKFTTEPMTSPEIQIGNSAPRIVSRPEIKFEGNVFRYEVEAKDPDGDRSLRFSLSGAPEGMTIDRLGGEIRWQPRPDQTGKYAIEVVVEDSQGGKDAQAFEVTVGSERPKPPAAPAARAEE